MQADVMSLMLLHEWGALGVVWEVCSGDSGGEKVEKFGKFGKLLEIQVERQVGRFEELFEFVSFSYLTFD